jgi:hypothetical protein
MAVRSRAYQDVHKEKFRFLNTEFSMLRLRVRQAEKWKKGGKHKAVENLSLDSRFPRLARNVKVSARYPPSRRRATKKFFALKAEDSGASECLHEGFLKELRLR